ncbi:DNA replication complex GINS protein PSF1 [Glycine soja]|nr:DNA replication complex GINS protein PSF1 [Glycine soja]
MEREKGIAQRQYIWRLQSLLRLSDIWELYRSSRKKNWRNLRESLEMSLSLSEHIVTGHGAETAMDVNEAMSRKTNEVEFMGLGATATIDLEEPNSNTKGKRQVSTLAMFDMGRGFWRENKAILEGGTSCFILRTSFFSLVFRSGVSHSCAFESYSSICSSTYFLLSTVRVVTRLRIVQYKNDLIREVVAECTQHHLDFQSLIRKMQEEGLDIQTAKNADHYGALIHHLAVVRNKRCLMAYMYNRAEIIRNLLWKIGHVLPQEIKVKLCNTEEEHFKNHSKALKNYMLKVEVDLTVDMVPPKDPYIKVRVIDDIGEGILLSDDKSANFALHSMHLLKRTDAEQFIAQGKMEELTG